MRIVQFGFMCLLTYRFIVFREIEDFNVRKRSRKEESYIKIKFF